MNENDEIIKKEFEEIQASRLDTFKRTIRAKLSGITQEYELIKELERKIGESKERIAKSQKEMRELKYEALDASQVIGQ